MGRRVEACVILLKYIQSLVVSEWIRRGLLFTFYGLYRTKNSKLKPGPDQSATLIALKIGI